MKQCRWKPGSACQHHKLNPALRTPADFFPACALCFTQAPSAFPQFFSTAFHFVENPQQDTILQSLANKGAAQGRGAGRNNCKCQEGAVTEGVMFLPSLFPHFQDSYSNSKTPGNSWPRPTLSDLKNIPQTEQGKNSRRTEKQGQGCALAEPSWDSDPHLIHCGTY